MHTCYMLIWCQVFEHLYKSWWCMQALVWQISTIIIMGVVSKPVISLPIQLFSWSNMALPGVGDLLMLLIGQVPGGWPANAANWACAWCLLQLFYLPHLWIESKGPGSRCDWVESLGWSVATRHGNKWQTIHANDIIGVFPSISWDWGFLLRPQ